MIVAVIVVDAMDVPVDEVVDMTGVRDRFVAAIDAVRVLEHVRFARMNRFVATGRYDVVELMLVDVCAVHVMQMAVVQKIDVTVVGDPDVAARRIVHVLVEVVHVMLGLGHDASAAWASPLRTSSATWPSTSE